MWSILNAEIKRRRVSHECYKKDTCAFVRVGLDLGFMIFLKLVPFSSAMFQRKILFKWSLTKWYHLNMAGRGGGCIPHQKLSQHLTPQLKFKVPPLSLTKLKYFIPFPFAPFKKIFSSPMSEEWGRGCHGTLSYFPSQFMCLSKT